MYEIRLIQSYSPFTTDVIYSPSQQDERPVESANLTMELNEGGSLSFTLPYGHPMYDSLSPLTSYVQVLEDGNEIFYGRIFSKSDPTIMGRITYEAEGALSFLQDSEVDPENRDSKGQLGSRTLTAEQFFNWCVQQHNADVNDPRRQFYPGTVNHSKKEKTATYQISNYTETKSAIQQYILDVYGGYLRVRRRTDGTHFLDWVETYGSTNPQQVNIGWNVTEQTNAFSGEGVFTSIRPVGSNGLTLNPKIIDVYPEEIMNAIGRIINTVTFDDCDTTAKLRAKADEYIEKIVKSFPLESNISLVDFHFLNGETAKIHLGDKFTNLYNIEGETMTVTAFDQDLLHVEIGQYSLKNQKELEVNGEGRGSKSSSKSGSRGGVSMQLKHYSETETLAKITADEVEINVTNTLIEHADEIRRTANDFSDYSRTNEQDKSAFSNTLSNLNQEVEGQGQILGEVKIQYEDIHGLVHDLKYDVEAIQGTGVIQNDQLITSIAGSFEVWTDQSSGRKIVHLVDGADISVDSATGGTITVGTLQTQYMENNHVINEMTGSALWTQKDQITGVCGEYDIDIDPLTGAKTLVLKSGGGMKIRHDGVEYGVYDDKTLTGGLLVDKINDTQTQSQLKGDRVIIGNLGTLSGDTLDEFAQKAYNGTGVFAKFLTVETLKAAFAEIGDADINGLNVGNVGSSSGLLNVYGNIVTQEFTASDADIGTLNVASLTFDEDNELKVLDVQPSGNILTITYTDGSQKTFSKAVTVSGNWGGISDPGRITVTARQNGEVVASYDKRLTNGAPSYNNTLHVWQYPVLAGNATGTDPNPVDTGYRVNINQSTARSTFLQDFEVTLSNTATLTPTDNYIGFSSVTVNVESAPSGPVTFDSVWNNGALTVTAKQSGSVVGSFYRKLTTGAKSLSGITYTVPIYVETSTGTPPPREDTHYNVTVQATEVFEEGWVAACDDLHIPVGQNTGRTYIVVGYPNSASVSGTPKSQTYTMVDTAKNYADLIAEVDGGQDIVVARLNHFRYNAGWNAAREYVSIPVAQETGKAYITVGYPNYTVDGTPQSQTYTMTDTAKNYSDLVASVGGQNIVVARLNHNRYNGGWTTAAASKSIPTGQNTSTAYITVGYPNSTVDGTMQTQTYTMTDNNKNSVNLNTSVGGQTITVARYTHNQYNAGWNTAEDDVSIPVGQNTSTAYITVGYPNSTVDGAAQTRTYTMTDAAKNYANLVTSVGGQNIVVARLTHNRYTGGWAAAYAKVSVPVGSSTSTAYITIQTPPSTVDGSAVSQTYTMSNADKNYANLNTTVGTQTITVARLTHNRYTGGWNAAYAKVSVPVGSSTSTAYITIQTPPSTVDGSAVSQTYTMSNADKNYANLVTSVGGQNIVVARLTHNRYTGGWNAAYAKVSVPVGSSTSTAYITVQTPPSTVDGSAVSQTYTMVNNNDNSVNLNTTVGTQTITVARFTHNKYNAGGASAWLTYADNDTYNSQGRLSPARRILLYYGGSSSNKVATWYVPEGWFVYSDAAKSEHQGTLTPGKYLNLCYRGGGVATTYTNYTWLVPDTASSSYTNKGNFKCTRSTVTAGLYRYTLEFETTNASLLNNGQTYAIYIKK